MLRWVVAGSFVARPLSAISSAAAAGGSSHQFPPRELSLRPPVQLAGFRSLQHRTRAYVFTCQLSDAYAVHLPLSTGPNSIS